MAGYKDSSPQAVGPGSKKKRPRPKNPYGSLGPSPGTVAKVNGKPTAAQIAAAKKAAQGLGKTVIDAAKGNSTSTPAPNTQKAAASAAEGGRTKADLISAYNLERAKILQGMAPQIQDIYQQAGANIGSAVDANTQAQHDELYRAGDEKYSEFNPDKVDPRIAASYEIGRAPTASAYLGKVLPQDTLNTQGASYGAAAAFLPAASLQEGQYALVKALQDEKVANADAEKVNPGVSKMLGYVADAYGNPITGKNGKPIKLPAQQMTPYQQAQLKLSAGRLDYQIASTNARMNYQQYKDDRNYKLSVDKAYAADKRYRDGLVYKSQQAKNVAAEKADTVDWTKTIALAKSQGGKGVLIDKNGHIMRDKHGRPLDFTVAKAPPKPGPKLTANQKVKLRADAADDARDAKNGWDDPATGHHPPMSYQEALKGMMGHYPIEFIYQALDRVYPPGVDGRPWLNLNMRNALIRRGIPQSAVEEAMFDKQKSIALSKMSKTQIKRIYGTARG